MAKKYPAKAPLPKQNTTASSKTASSSGFAFTLDNLAPLVICIVYLLVHFINNMAAYDAMGPQWLFLVIVDLLAILFILGRKSRYDIAVNNVLRNLFSKLYIAFFVLAGLSTFVAINPTETWVCYVRLIATIIAFFNISILMYGRINLIPLLAQLLGIVLLVESIQTLVQFLDEANRLTMTEAIMNMKGTTGNKNIFAAGLVLKIPFVMYLIHTGKLWRKIINIIILTISGTALFIVSARASYLSLLLITLLYIVFAILENKKEKSIERLLYRTGSVLVPIIIAFMISQIELSNVKSMQDPNLDANIYGTVTERFGTLSNTSDESNAVRLRLWSHAIDYTVKHPLIGCGYGNWKIASIPYQRTITNDLYVPVHAHNDFVENFAELGIPGGLLYLSLFVVIAIFTFRTYYSNAGQATKFASVFSLLAFTGYSVDAFFNFPAERPINQVFFSLITAINVVAYLDARKAEETQKRNPSPSAVKAIYGFSSILLLLPSLYITYLTYQSLIIQRKLIPDLNNEPLQLKWQEIFPQIPSIPNISASAQPLDAIKGRYLSEAGKYDEALALLDKGSKANPVIGYSEFLKAGIYFKQGKMDSAQRNAQYAFNIRPKAKTYYQTLMAVLAQTKDTIAIEKAFKEYITYRDQPFGYEMYLRAMLQAQGKGSPKLLAVADSAYRKFTGHPEAGSLNERKLEIQRFMNVVPASSGNAAIQAQQLAKAQNYYTAGVNAFTKAKAGTPPANRADYVTAARNFISAGEIITNNYIIYENAGIAYFNLQDYTKAIQYFDRAINMKTSVDGKSEYFKGVSLYNLGKQPEGCVFIRMAAGKGYAEAAAVAKSNCK
jgi:O-antigen ligase/tetratricopeptide (TPR) repeat protein